MADVLPLSACPHYAGARAGDRSFTKIMATPGLATRSEEAITQFLRDGVAMFRLNMSHGTHESHSEVIATIRRVCARLNRLCAILLDTKGPEIRTGALKDHAEVELSQGDDFYLHTDPGYVGTAEGVSVTYAQLPGSVSPGDQVLLDDGLISLLVLETEREDGAVWCRVLNDGVLGEHKGVNIPGVPVDLPAVTANDVRDIEFGVREGVDFLGMSFIRTPEAVLEIRRLVEGSGIKIFSKIESQEGLDNLEEIAKVSDGITIARGDLGIEIPLEQIPIVQKRAILFCNSIGRPVITATQMLNNMMTRPHPTSAEVTDVTNAVVDGTDCVSLSAETAKGKYPHAVVSMATKILHQAEASLEYDRVQSRMRSIRSMAKEAPKNRVADALASSLVGLAQDLGAKLIVTLTTTGYSSLMVASYRPQAAIVAVTRDAKVARQLLPSRGMYPIVVREDATFEQAVEVAQHMAKTSGLCSAGDPCVVVVGKLGWGVAPPYVVQLTDVVPDREGL